MASSSTAKSIEELTAIAMEEARERGLPPGWKVKFSGKQRRRKWISPGPNSRIYDSMPKALVAAGLLPSKTPDTDAGAGQKRSSARDDTPPVSFADDFVTYAAPGSGPSNVGAAAATETESKKKKAKLGASLVATTNTDDGVNNAETNTEGGPVLVVASSKLVATSTSSLPEVSSAIATSDGCNDGAIDVNKKDLHLLSDAASSSNAASAPPTAALRQQPQVTVVDKEEEPTSDPESDPETSLDVNVFPSSPVKSFASESPSSQHLSSQCLSPTKTVHWDPSTWEGRVIGSRVRVSDGKHDNKTSKWKMGRIIGFDPISRRHKIEFYAPDSHHIRDDNTKESSISGPVLGYEWLYLKDPEIRVVQIGTRFVWALVRGFAWWPAQVMVTIGSNLPKDMSQQAREGYVYVEFFGSDQVAVIKDLPEFVRPFNKGEVDAVVRKSKKKRDAAAIEIASAEENATINARNEAVRHLATKAFHLSNRSAGMCLGRRVQFFRDDVNYPYGEVVSGVVRQYSCLAKKWLVDYLPSAADDKATSYRALIASTSCGSSVNVPYPPSWVNLSDKKCDLKLLPEEREWVDVTQAPPRKKRKKSKKGVGTSGRTLVPTLDDLAPFLFGYDDVSFSSDYVKKKCLACLRDTSSGGCLPQESTSGEPDHAIVLTCHSCRRMFHPSCLDPPIAVRVARKIIEEQQMLEQNENTDNAQVDGFWTCDKCTRCEGCHELDIVYGTRMYPKPVTITGLSCDSSVESSVQTTVKENYHPQLCSMCTVKYDDGQYCPNCGCTFDDIRYYKARRARLWRRRNIKNKAGFDSDNNEMVSSSLTSSDATKDGSASVGAGESSTTTELHSIVSKRSTLPDRDWFRSDSMVWGFNESSMLTCDSCHKWVHAGCARLTRDEYNLINQHKHPIYNAEFLCGNCCRERCQTLMKMLKSEDSMHLFAAPVTEEVAPNYRDVISHPMDLQTLANLMKKGDYNSSNYLWVKEYFELMVLNALVFNPPNSKYWNEAKRYHAACLGKVFNNSLTPAVAHSSTKFSERVHACYDRGQRELENEQDRKKSDETATKKDLVAGAEVTSVQLLPLSKASDVPSCVPHAVVRFNNVDAHYTCWLDACFSCGSSGAADTMLFCVDCGEAYHSFCANAPIWSMDKVAMAAWRCPNCKLCEISADVPDDETKLLYCEMCDRAFRFDLLDPQLDFVPPGLWICGQCVDCASCKGDEPASLKFWSRDPRLCYGCGGCKGLVERKTKNMDCQVCGRLWRKSDHGVVKCSGCRLSVHVACDPYAKKYARKGQSLGEEVPTEKGPSAGNGPTTLYKCPRCRKAKEKRKQELEREREAKKLCRQMKPSKKTVQKVSTQELHRKLEDALEWQVKEMWRSEYKSIVSDASEMLKMANEYCDRILAPSDCLGTPEWIFPRAARFFRLSKRGSRLKSARQRRSGSAAHSVVTGHSAPLSTTNAAATCTEAPPSKEEHISVLVSRAKNASAFLFLTCRFFGVEMRTSVTCWKRAISMLTPPNEAGIVQLPHDNVKLEGGHIMEETKWRKAPIKVSGHLPQKLKEFSIQRRPSTQKPSKKVPKLQSRAISVAAGTSISSISVPHQPPPRVMDKGICDAASHPRNQSSNDHSSVVGKADAKSTVGCTDHGGCVSPGVRSQSKSVAGNRKVSFGASKDVNADSHAITFDEVSPLSVAKRSEVAPGNKIEQGSEKASSVSVSTSDSVAPKHMSAKASPVCPSKDAVRTTISVSQHKKANVDSGAPRSVRQQSLVVDEMTVKSASFNLEKKEKLPDNMSNQTACSDSETKPIGKASYSSSESSQKPEATSSSDRKPLYTRKVRHLNIPLASPMRGWGDGEVIGGDDMVQAKWADPRTCCLCHTCGDDDAGIPPKENAPSENVCSVSSEGQIGRAGRLLPMASGAWVHLSCALWSSEVWESADGAIHSVDKARYRGSKMKCFGCGRPGPTLGCSKVNCSVNYHFPCAGHCGAVFTSKQQMFCRNHRGHAPEVVRPERASFEHMKALRVVDREVLEPGESAPCFRIGTLVVHSLGTIEQDHDGFHSKHYITPPGYTASRIFWSFRKKRTRTLYIMRVDCSRHGEPIFSITAADDASSPIQGGTVEEVYQTLISRVMKVNESLFSHGDLYSHLPRKRMRMSTYGLNGPQFFGFGLEITRRALELSPGVAAVAVPLSKTSQTYDFCFTHPSKDDIMDLQRKRAAAAAEKALENMSGSARTEGMRAVDRSGGSGRITRALVKSADEDTSKPTPDVLVKDVEAGASNDINDTNQALYDEMKAVPLETRLAAKRSHIHGWGLFTKVDLPKHSMIIEYMGETIRQCVADKRERSYELSGIGSCYMFRLDANRIVDATMIGCMARFMNHCCRPNAYAKIITVETDSGFEKKIAVFANRNIASGEEITYDYKFPVEDGSLKCTCGAPNCIGRMN